MKKITTIWFKAFLLLVLCTAWGGAALAQYTSTTVETGGLYTAVTRDKSNNIYVTRATTATTYEVEVYTGGTGTPAVLATGLTHEAADFPWGLAVTSTGNIFISTDFTVAGGSITELVKNGSTYNAPITYQTGHYVSALAVDGSDNLYTAEYDATNKVYAVVKYPANSAPNPTGTNIFDQLSSVRGYTYPTGLVVAPNGDVYVADAFSNSQAWTYGGKIYKLTAASSYASSVFSSGKYATSLAFDASGNLYSSEISGSGYALVRYNSVGSPFVVYNALHTNSFYYPWGIAVVGLTNIFVGDGDDHVNGGSLFHLTATSVPTLSSLSLTAPYAALTTVAGPDFKDYTASVPNSASSIKVIPTTTDPNAKITINGAAAVSGSASAPVYLAVGSNPITIVVTAQDGVTKDTYVITVTRAPSSNAILSALSLTAPDTYLTTVTGPDYRDYTAIVPYTATSIEVLPTAADPTATIKINGNAAVSGLASAPINLAVGPNVINVVVTAQDGVTQNTYAITVTRRSNVATLKSLSLTSPFAALTTVSGPDFRDYTASVPNSAASIKVVPTTTNAYATITINGTAATSGVASAPVSLAVGPNTITIVVTAQDGVTKDTYVITVTRISNDALLSALSLTSPYAALTAVSGPDYKDYTASVSAGTSSIEVLATADNSNATFTINGSAATSGAASAPVSLAGGPNAITIVVTAQDGVTTKTYKITVTRPLSTNANLSSISLTSPYAALTTVSGADYRDYTASVDNSVTSIKVLPTAADATATITVNGTATASGAASAAIPLSVGANTITTVCTAQDGVTTHSYVITVTRAGPIAADAFEPVGVSQPNEAPELADDVLVVHRGVTPNGDGIDDHFVIDGILAYPDNKLTIMNRNGQLVYEANGYDNTTKTFDGHSNKTGQMQLPGTYFFALDYTVNGVIKHKTGFLVLKY